MKETEYVGRMLNCVEIELNTLGTPFEVIVTRSANAKFKTDPDCLYVIRQQQKDDVLTLTVAAKMGKEVS